MKVWTSLKKEQRSVSKKVYDEFLAKSKSLDEEYFAKRRTLEKEFDQQVKATVKKDKKPKQEAPVAWTVPTTPPPIVQGSDGPVHQDLTPFQNGRLKPPVV